MNRQQAEHLLNAYIELECTGGDNKVRQSLREVILDAMTHPKYIPINQQPWTGKPIVTYTPPYTVTCTGTDPAFNQITGVDA